MLVGTIGDLTFYKRGNGYFVREKGGNKPKAVMTEEEFLRSYENSLEFQLATRHGHGIRTALRGIVYGLQEVGNSGKQAGKIMRCIRTNPVGERGKRKLHPATLAEYLEGHEFNSRSTLPVNFELYESGGLNVNVSRIMGMVDVIFDSHDPTTDIVAPGLADEYSFVAGVAWWDGTENDVQGSVRCGWRGNWAESTRYDVENTSVTAPVLQPVFPVGFSGLLVVVAGIRYWKDDGTADGFWLRLQSCLRVVKVEG